MSSSCGPFRTGRWRVWRADSCGVLDEADEDVFQRALPGLQVAELDSGLLQVVQQSGDVAVLAARVISVDELVAVFGKPQVVGVQRRRNLGQRLCELERQ